MHVHPRQYLTLPVNFLRELARSKYPLIAGSVVLLALTVPYVLWEGHEQALRHAATLSREAHAQLTHTVLMLDKVAFAGGCVLAVLLTLALHWAAAAGSRSARLQEINRKLQSEVEERQRVEQELRESEERFRVMADTAPVMIWMSGPDSVATFFNRRCLEFTGRRSQNELGGTGWIEVVHESDRPYALETYRTAFDKAEAFTLEFRLRRADGEYRWLVNTGVPRFLADGTFAGYVGSCIDITDHRVAQQRVNELNAELEQRVLERTLQLETANHELKKEIAERLRTEEALRHSETSFHGLFENAPLGIFRAVIGGKLLDANPAFVQMLGYATRAEVLELNLHHDICGLKDCSKCLLERVRDEGRLSGAELEWRRKDGSHITVHLSGRCVRAAKTTGPSPSAADGGFIEMMAEDFTERLKLEAQLRQSHKMEAVGLLAAGVAHDFNNLLTGIILYGGLLQNHVQADEDAQRKVHEILNAAERGATLIQQLLAFGRKQMLAPAIVDLNQVVQEMRAMLRRLIAENIELVFELGNKLGHVKVDPCQIQQVLLNLAANARDAMPQGGKLCIRTANVDIDEPQARREPPLEPGKYVLLTVKDYGVGMDSHTRARIFEPFFTTKEKGKGTGLGLATVYGIVKQSGGHIFVNSKPGHGSTFKIYLPRVGPAKVEKSEKEREVILHEAPTILLVEDEDIVREATANFLENRGYRVLQASGGPEAVSMASQMDGALDLLLTDVVMPGMSGPELAERIRQIRPDIKALYMSGYAENTVLQYGVRDLKTMFLQKPFSLQALSSKLDQLLEVMPQATAAPPPACHLATGSR